jgi:hypothetical protein
MASRTIDKILRGLQRIATIIIIARGIHDAYELLKSKGSSSNNDNSTDKDTGKDKLITEENKPKSVPIRVQKNEK